MSENYKLSTLSMFVLKYCFIKLALRLVTIYLIVKVSSTPDLDGIKLFS